MLGTGAFALLLPDEADARRRKRRRRRRRKARVTEPSSPITLLPGDNIINITNPSPDKPLTISEVRVIGEDGSVIETVPLAEDVTIQPLQTGDVTFDLTGLLTDTELLRADGLRLIDERGVPITIVDEDGVKVGVGDIDVL
jgi:hypothetical protein